MASPLFGFVQLEFGFLLGPPDGRYMVRANPAAEPETVLALTTLGAVERRLLRGRRGHSVDRAEPEPVPTSRATAIRTEPFATAGHAESWLAAVRDDGDRRERETDTAVAVLNQALRAWRAASADPYVRDVDLARALVARIGFGSGDAVVGGLYEQAWELPRHGIARARRSMEAPEERFAALLGGRQEILACEELVLRARADLDAHRDREAALQARVALEALLAELPHPPGDRRGPLEADRGPIGAAANAALTGSLSEDLTDALIAAVERMEDALRARRLGTDRG
ncbi:MAG: hypothetical protein GXY03_06555 [Solirubrobacterales bacterium]|nr:hypothetical protein [Solirubrobacterales bacterium]